MKFPVVLSIVLAFASIAYGHATYIGYSGAPGSRGSCSISCHEQHDFSSSIAITGFPATYQPGGQYTIAVAHSSGSSILQFNASVRIGTGSTNAGVIAAGANTATYNHAQETNGVHFSSTGQNTGTFLWTAPAPGAGTVRLYWVGLQGSGLSSGSDTAIVLVSNEGAPDQPPVLATIGPQSVSEGSHLALRVTASDPDNDVITLSTAGLPAHAAFVDSSGGVGGFTFDPDFTQAGAIQVLFIALANIHSDTELVTVTVTDTDRPPVLAAIPPQTVPEGGHLGVRISATDPDGNTIALSARNLPLNANFADSTGGVGGFEFNPDTSQIDVYNVEFIAAAGILADTASMQVTVTEAGGCIYVPGDINGNGAANGIDVVYGVAYLKGGTPPITDCNPPCTGQPDPFFASMDVNGNCAANGIDITYFVAFLKGLQPTVQYCPGCPPAR